MVSSGASASLREIAKRRRLSLREKRPWTTTAKARGNGTNLLRAHKTRHTPCNTHDAFTLGPPFHPGDTRVQSETPAYSRRQCSSTTRRDRDRSREWEQELALCAVLAEQIAEAVCSSVLDAGPRVDVGHLDAPCADHASWRTVGSTDRRLNGLATDG